MKHVHPSRLEREQILPDLKLGDVLNDVTAKVLRRWQLLSAAVGAAVIVAIFYVITATPTFTANGALLIDPRTGQDPGSQAQISSALLMSDALTVDSEIRVLTSREVTGSTVKALSFVGEEPEEPSLFQQFKGAIRNLFPRAEPAPVDPGAADYAEAIAFETLRQTFVKPMDVARSGDTFVVDVSYSDASPVFAANAVNTLMEEYLRLSSKQRTSNIERNREWLAGRIAELGREVEEAENVVANYRQEFDLLTPEGQRLPTEVAIGAAVESIVSLRREALSLEIELGQLNDNIARRDFNSVQVPPESRTQALVGFQNKLAELQAEEQNLLRNWSEDSPVVVDLREQLAATGDLILGELTKVAAQLEGRYSTLNRQLQANEIVIAELRSEYGEEVRRTVDLQRLERELEAKKTLYEELLEDFNNASQMLTFDTTSARVIAWAVPPSRQSAPQSRRVVLLAAMGSFILAVSIILMIESFDESFRRKDEVKEFLGLDVIGTIPHFEQEIRDWKLGEARPPYQSEPTGIFGDRLTEYAKRFDFAVRNPFSFAADALRNLHTKLRFDSDGKPNEGRSIVIGFTSTERDEGKTTTAANFAALMASRGEATALVDLDLITQKLSHQVDTDTLEGLLAPGNLKLPIADSDVMNSHVENDNKPIFVSPPSSLTGHQIGPTDVDTLEYFFQELRQHFDYIVADLPPLQGTADTQLLALPCDKLVFLVRWGATPREKALNALKSLNYYQSKVIGVLFTRASMKTYRSYNKYEGVEYYG